MSGHELMIKIGFTQQTQNKYNGGSFVDGLFVDIRLIHHGWANLDWRPIRVRGWSIHAENHRDQETDTIVGRVCGVCKEEVAIRILNGPQGWYATSDDAVDDAIYFRNPGAIN